VLTTSNGPEALEELQAQEPDIIVLDVVSFETLKQIRERNSSNQERSTA